MGRLLLVLIVNLFSLTCRASLTRSCGLLGFERRRDPLL